MNYKQNCLDALRLFITEATNEQKLELYLAYEELESETERLAELGQDLDAAFQTILYQNKHDDGFLRSLQAQFFA